MNKVRVFFMVAALLLCITGILAGRSRFALVGLYAINASSNIQIAPSYVGLTIAFITGDQQATLVDRRGVVYGLYTYDNVAKQFLPLYSTNW